MRLRQIALASRDLDGVIGALGSVFGLKVAYNDPHIKHYGLRNAVLSAGTGFLEVVEPLVESASAARFLNRRGGDAGYMLILQVADAEAERARIAALGVRVVDDIDQPGYRCAHFHPGDFGGVLTSVDQQRTEPDLLAPYGDWMPAGPDWRAARSETVLDVAAVTLTTPDPGALAARWSELLNRPLDANDPLRLPLDHGEIWFASAEAGAGTSVASIELKVAEPAAALARAADAGLDVDPAGVLIGGVRFLPTTGA
jgi:Glyoxalase-like domain